MLISISSGLFLSYVLIEDLNEPFSNTSPSGVVVFRDEDTVAELSIDCSSALTRLRRSLVSSAI